MRTPPATALVAVLRRPDLLLAKVIDAAAAEAALLLGAPFTSRVILSPSVRKERLLPHASSLRRLGDLDWSRAFLYRETYHPHKLEELLRRHCPSYFAAVTAVVTDVEIQPPPDWRYMIFRALGARGALVSLAPLDPLFWGEATRDRARFLKTRLRAALIASLLPALGVHSCAEPGCFFDRSVDGIDAIDGMETVGPTHSRHPSLGRRFAPARRALDLDRLEAAEPRSRLRHPNAFERRPARPLPIAVRWEAGPRAALEIFNARKLASGRIVFERRHETPWAPTVRPPVETVEVDPDAFSRVRESMERALAAASFRGINVPMPPSPDRPLEPTLATPLGELRQAGGRLYDIVFPLALERGLTRKGVHLEIGIDEILLDEPFELMHDHEGFIALKHFVGRFVNASTPRPAAHRGALDRRDARGSKLRALVVGAGRAKLAPGRPLPHAEAEARATVAALSRLGAHTTELVGDAATVAAVYEALRSGPHLFHYSGHAELGGPGTLSNLLLADGNLDGESLARVAARWPPLVALLNACEAGRVPSFADSLRIQGLVDAMLVAGSYVVAARWPVTDGAAHAFASAFYDELLHAGQPLGVATTRGREAAREEAPADDLTWAAYVLYGDPKLALGPGER